MPKADDYLNDVSDFTTIDPAQLEVELRRQPRLVRHYGELEADAKHAHARAKARLKLAAAQLTLKARRSPGSFKLRENPTKDEVDAAVVASAKYQEAEAEADEAKRQLDHLAVAVTTLEDRRYSLKGEVELFLRDWHGEIPVGTRDGRDRVHDAERQSVSDKINARQGRAKK